jgi:hypothetical protein
VIFPEVIIVFKLVLLVAIVVVVTVICDDAPDESVVIGLFMWVSKIPAAIAAPVNKSNAMLKRIKHNDEQQQNPYLQMNE